MARRSAVVVSQAAGATSEQREFEEELIATLLMEKGVDVNVIPHLDQLEPGGTGVLCLEGIKGDMILAGWLEPEAARQTLAEHDVPGRWHGEPEDSANGRQRTVHYLSLADDATLDGCLSKIRGIHRDAQVQTVGLLNTAPPTTQPKPLSITSPLPIAPSVPATTSSAEASQSNAGQPADSRPVGGDRPTTQPTEVALTSEQREFEDELDDEMESLVDELDELDI